MVVFGMVIIVKNSVLQKQMQTIGFQKSRRTVSVSVFTYCHKKTDQERRLAQFC